MQESNRCSDPSEPGFIRRQTQQFYLHGSLIMVVFHEMIMLLFLWPVLPLGSASPDVPTNNEHYPPMWELVPESQTDFTNNKVINPWNYLDRMAMYKMMLNATEPYLDMKEPGNKKNLLWGLPLQHGWQYLTDRLRDTSVQPSSGQNEQEQTRISPKSWWACMNYYLAVIPFLAALDAGLLQGITYDIVIAPPSEFESDFCCSVKECRLSCPKAMNEWTIFFQSIKTLNQVSDISIPPLSKKEDQALSYMWNAHVESIYTALPHCSARLNYLSEPEKSFGMEWATTVDFIAATNFPTDLESTNNFQIFLPTRILVNGDKAPNIPDFSEQQNRVLATLHFLYESNKFSGGLILRLWRKAMCSEKGRAEGRNLLYNMVHDPKLVPQTMIKIIIKMASACEEAKNRKK
ncbi:protein LEG1 homolog [Phyllobates terribilis]|uniref:protein LEG1 homolog n=1 Tax=Phyllobates terribilis TaxID=111132 RepID=UPI003CCAB940